MEHTLKETPISHTWFLVSWDTKVQVWGRLVRCWFCLAKKRGRKWNKKREKIKQEKKEGKKKKGEESESEPAWSTLTKGHTTSVPSSHGVHLDIHLFAAWLHLALLSLTLAKPWHNPHPLRAFASLCSSSFCAHKARGMLLFPSKPLLLHSD
jgi:hypothetical protein